MMLAIITIIGTGIVTHGAHLVYYKFKRERAIKPDLTWQYRPILEGDAWVEFLRCIKEDCKGWKLSHALIKAVFNNGFRFTCAQIYEVAALHGTRFQGTEDKVKDLMMYELTVLCEAQDRVEKLIIGGDEQFMLSGKTV